jgi:DNA-directed RNA polymerase specialized sigma24 family protein
MVSEADWLLLIAIAEGRDYGEIADALGVTPGHLRVRVLRLRRELLRRSQMSQSSRRAA